MERLGVTIGLEGGSVAQAVDVCREAERLGYTDVWSAEVGGSDGLSPLAALASVTERVRLGTAILPVFTRPPALLAMSAATLHSLSGGRFVLGLGTSSSIIVEQWMGADFSQPLQRLAEYVDVVRSALNGEKVSREGETVALKGFRLQLDPGSPVPIYVAALGPAACRLAGRVADGVILFLKSPSGVEQALEWVEQGARAAGRDASQLDRVIRLPVALDEGAARTLARKLLTTYAIVDVYNRSLVTQGFDEAGEIAQRFWSGDRKGAAAAVSDDMIDQLFVLGDAATCRSRLEDFRKAGITTPVLLPLSTSQEPSEQAAVVQALAPG